jgi:hypothetical protein
MNTTRLHRTPRQSSKYAARAKKVSPVFLTTAHVAPFATALSPARNLFENSWPVQIQRDTDHRPAYLAGPLFLTRKRIAWRVCTDDS